VRRVFDGLSGSSPAGKAAKARIRQGLDAYDEVGIHPHLGDPNASSTHKWRQYVLPDDDHIVAPGACPFAVPKGATP
jgi:FPC/CPF motif-containing protein YcgG